MQRRYGQVLQQRFCTAVCTAASMTAAAVHPPSVVLYSSNEGAEEFMEERSRVHAYQKHACTILRLVPV